MPILEGKVDESLIGDTHREVRNLRKNNVFLSNEDIAKKVGVTRQRVRAILIREGLSTRAVIRKTVVYCKECQTPTLNGQVVCSEKCREAHYYTFVNCRSCLKKIRYLKSYLKTRIKFNMNRYFYCSRECYYAGRKDGIS